MAIAIDLVVVAILGLCIFFGYKNGLTKSLIKILSFVIAVVVAAIFFKPVSNLVIDNTEVDENIKQAVVNLVSKDVEETGEVKEDTNLPQGMVDFINNTVGDAIEEAKASVEEAKNVAVEKASSTIAETTINVGVAILIFIVVRIALIFVSALSELFTDLPGIKQFDKTGGVIYGVVKALLIIFVLFAVISLISPAIEQTGIIVAINKSFIGSFLYNNNVLLNMVL